MGTGMSVGMCRCWCRCVVRREKKKDGEMER